jgi:uncharacterized protein (DUF433 family)
MMSSSFASISKNITTAVDSIPISSTINWENESIKHEINTLQYFLVFLLSKCQTMNLLDRITIHPEIVHGKPAIRGMRWTVEMIIDLLGSGMSVEEIIEDHPEFEKEDILASLKFAGMYLSGQPLQNIN